MNAKRWCPVDTLEAPTGKPVDVRRVKNVLRQWGVLLILGASSGPGVREELTYRKVMKTIKKIVAVSGALCLACGAALAETDPTAVITAADGKYNASVAIYIAAAVIGAGLMYIRKGLKGRM